MDTKEEADILMCPNCRSLAMTPKGVEVYKGLHNRIEELLIDRAKKEMEPALIILTPKEIEEISKLSNGENVLISYDTSSGIGPIVHKNKQKDYGSVPMIDITDMESW
jgi:hypothetical protein